MSDIPNRGDLDIAGKPEPARFFNRRLDDFIAAHAMARGEIAPVTMLVWPG